MRTGNHIIKGQAWRALWVCALLSAAILLAFWPVLRNGFIRFDDPDYILDNPHVRSGLSWRNVVWALQSGYASNWHPLTWLSHMLDVQLFGLNAGAHHFVSLLLHIGNTLLLFLWLRRLTGAVAASAFVAAFFGLHPLHVESVAWASERKDVLSTFFFLLTLLAYTRYVETGREKQSEGKSENAQPGSVLLLPASNFYFLSLFFFALGLMSKPMLVTLPCILLLLDFWPLARFPQFGAASALGCCRALFYEKIPFFCLAAACSLVTLLVQDKSHAITIGLPLLLRLENAIASFVKYLAKTIWPAHLAIFYPHPDARYFAPVTDLAHPRSAQWALWILAIAALGLVAVCVLAILGRRQRPWLTTGWFWYLGTLLPVIGIIQMGSQAMADRYTYIPLIGIFICVIWGARALVPAEGMGPKMLVGAGLLALTVCGVLTRKQTMYWRDDATVFEHALAVTGDNAWAQYHLGVALGERGQYDQAMVHFQAALAADPSFGEAFCGRAYTLELMGKPKEAVEEYRAGLKLRPFNTKARHRLAALLLAQGKRDEALDQYAESLRFEPENAETHFLAGVALLGAGQLAEAEAQFSAAARLQPDYIPALDQLAQTLFREGKLPQAVARFQEVVRLDPALVEPHINLGGTLWRLGQRDAALVEFNEALRLKPAHPVAHYDLATVLLAQGRVADAVAELQQAVRLKPDYPEALNDLGRALAFQGKFDEAQARFLDLLRLCPTNAAFQMSFGSALLMAGRTNEAQARLAEAVRLEPALPEKLVRAAMALASQSRPDEAIAQFRTVLRLRPDWPIALNNLAWLLATHPQAEARRGAEAVLLAERACALSGGKEPRYWNTLAAAYAATSRFAEAVTTAEKAKALAQAAGDKQAAEAAEQRLIFYRKQQPYHQ
jgi:tetratricopeptide (TPR) repeat protein